jgi:predicted porin
MKKSLLTLVVLGTVAGVASAQSNVTIYGVADVGLTHARSDTTSGRVHLDSGVQSGSRLGFKGTEDIGGGLSASFQLETGYGVDTGALGQGGRIFGRQAWVGLDGAFGSVKFGRQYMPLFLAVDSIDPFGTALGGDASAWLGGNVHAGIDVRMDNTINYSISTGGFSGEFAYGLGESGGSSSDDRQIGFSVGYAAGPLHIVAGHHNVDVGGTGTVRTSLIGGTYDFGPVKMHAGLDTQKNESGGATTLKARAGMVGISAPVGSGTVLATYIRGDDRSAANVDSSQVALGYLHSLSKRTNLYTSFARVDTNGVRRFSAGIRHKF